MLAERVLCVWRQEVMGGSVCDVRRMRALLASLSLLHTIILSPAALHQINVSKHSYCAIVYQKVKETRQHEFCWLL